ncbi:MAG: LacI family DNA-binding transcriptional regulator, partial [Anaerolineae bacterium]|nr:LacI family DNA-binding transcriptional regulator [Anaerolineae bacterium]MDW8070655.1 LacI family DNA-binding transcriptional regulator [Anaerolineae bacterium]
EQLGYVPNVVARRLQKQRADAIGLILPSYGPRLSDPLFGDILSAAADEITRAGLDLLVSIAHRPEDEVEPYYQRVGERRVDSVWVVHTRCHDRRIAYLLERRVPFIASGRVLEDWTFPHVDVDYARGMHNLVSHLVQLGHQRIAFAGESVELTSVHYQREGFRHALREHGLAVDEDLIAESHPTQRGGYDAAQTLLSRRHPPTAIIAGNDLMALGVMSAIQDQGLEVGRDVAVAGFGDIPLAETSYPTLTTVRIPAQQMGRMVGQMLVMSARGQEIPNPCVLLQPELIIRQSTDLDLWL